MKWILENGNNINFWFDNWMEDSPLFNKVYPNMQHFVSSQTKVSDFIIINKKWNLPNLNNILPCRIFEKFYKISLHVI